MTCSASLDRICRGRIAVLGHGREGRSAVRAISRHRPGADITVLVESGQGPSDLPTRTGPFVASDLEAFDVLVRSPGIPVDHPALAACRERGGCIVNPSSIWFSERGDIPVVGVTGSKGKSTTAALLSHLLAACGRRVLLAGNIGVPLLDHLDTDADVVVMELSSYQLADLEGRLELGIVTRLFAEHIDWHGSLERYTAAKLRIADLLAGRPLVINAADPVLVEATASIRSRVAGNRPPRIHRVDDELVLADRRLIGGSETALVGRHNLDNAALAIDAGILLGEPVEILVDALRDFRPLSHRLETVGEKAGVRWINDSIATSPHATLAALQSLESEEVILIAGGQRRPADWTGVVEWLGREGLFGLITLPDNGPGIQASFSRAGLVPRVGMHSAETVEEAVGIASRLGRPGVVVLLSPGAPSFPHFRDFEQRGERFVEAVGALAAGA
ncbi:MAG: UDP-N-acetylmuramoyl-L-alanine--D-glutamate ligase [Wenzhouxiangella sp.]